MLYKNDLSGFILKEIDNLNYVIDLQLSANQLYDFIPLSFGNLSNVQALYVHCNSLFRFHS